MASSQLPSLTVSATHCQTNRLLACSGWVWLRTEGMVIFYIYHRTNNYGHTNLGAFLLKYDRIMRYKQRHIIIKATPHDQSMLLVTCRIDNVTSVCCKRQVI